MNVKTVKIIRDLELWQRFQRIARLISINEFTSNFEKIIVKCGTQLPVLAKSSDEEYIFVFIPTGSVAIVNKYYCCENE